MNYEIGVLIAYVVLIFLVRILTALHRRNDL